MFRRLIPAVLATATLAIFALNAQNARPSGTVSTLSASATQIPHVFREEIRQEEHRAQLDAARQAQAEAARQAQAQAAAKIAQHQAAVRASRSAPAQTPPPTPGPVYSDNGGLPAGLLCIREHESHNNYADVDKSHSYFGAYQYSKSTWANYGGYTYASDAPPNIQDKRALSDYSKGYRQIHQNWPTTSRMCGL